VIDIAARLDVVLADGMKLRIDGHGRDIDVRISSDPAGIVRTLLGARKTLPLLRAATQMLAKAGIEATLYAGDRAIGKIGRGVESDGAAKILGISNARIGT